MAFQMTPEQAYAAIQGQNTFTPSTGFQGGVAPADHSGYGMNAITGKSANPYTSANAAYNWFDPAYLSHIRNMLAPSSSMGDSGTGQQANPQNNFQFTGPDGVPMIAMGVGGDRVRIFKDPGGIRGGWMKGGDTTKLNGVAYDEYGADGKLLGSHQFENIKNSMGAPWQALGVAIGGPLAGMGLNAAGLGLPAAAEAGAAAGLNTAGLTGGGFVGEGALSGIGAWDAALAGAPSWSAAGGMGAGAASASGGGGGGGMAGVPPPANPALGGGGGGVLDKLTAALGGGGGGFSWTDLIGPALNLAGGVYGASQAGKAADSQLQGQREAMALAEPWRQAGMAGLNRLQEELGIGGDPNAANYGRSARDFSMSDFTEDPGYQFRQDRGMKALERSAAARGGLYSGKAIKDTLDFSQGLASQEYGRAFDRFQVSRTNRLNPLQSISGGGQTAANTMGAYASNAGDAQAAGIMGKSNALIGALGNGVSMYQNSQNNRAEQNILDRMLRARGY